MLEWLKRKAADKQERNVRDTVAELIKISNESVATIARLGDSFPRQRKVIHKLQKRLAVDFIGPMPLPEIKRHILDPALQAPGVTDGARKES